MSKNEAAITRETVTLQGRGVRLAADLIRGDAHRGTAVLLPGGGQTRHSWNRTADALAVAGWTTLSLDARGHGDSEWAADGGYELDQLVDDLLLVLGTLSEPPVLIGASMGGLTALIAEGERGPIARAVVLVDIVPRLQPAGVERILRFMTAHLDGFASLGDVARAVEAYNPTRKRSTDLEGLKKNVRLRADGRWYWHWDPALLSRKSTDEQSRDLPVNRMLQAAGEIAVPVLVVRGGQSDVVSDDGVQELLRQLRHGTTVEVGSAGHMIAGDENTSFANVILSYLAGLPR